MFCDNCKVEINGLGSNCPLCGKYLSNTSNEIRDVYPKFQVLTARKRKAALKLLIFISLVVTLVVFTVNLLTPHSSLWSIIASSGVWAAFFVLELPIALKKITPGMILWDNVVVSILLVIVDATLGWGGWSMNYAVPFVLSGSAFIVTVIVMCTKMTYKEFYLFQITIAAICFIPIIARWFIKFVFWPSLISAMYGVITILGMIIFGDSELKYEMRKRLHF